MEPAGDFGAQSVRYAVLAPVQHPNEEGDAFVPEFNIGPHVVAIITAAHFDRLEAGRLKVLENQVFVVVLAVDLELDLDEVPTLDDRISSRWARGDIARCAGRSTLRGHQRLKPACCL